MGSFNQKKIKRKQTISKKCTIILAVRPALISTSTRRYDHSGAILEMALQDLFEISFIIMDTFPESLHILKSLLYVRCVENWLKPHLATKTNGGTAGSLWGSLAMKRRKFCEST